MYMYNLSHQCSPPSTTYGQDTQSTALYQSNPYTSLHHMSCIPPRLMFRCTPLHSRSHRSPTPRSFLKDTANTALHHSNSCMTPRDTPCKSHCLLIRYTRQRMCNSVHECSPKPWLILQDTTSTPPCQSNPCMTLEDMPCTPTRLTLQCTRPNICKTSEMHSPGVSSSMQDNCREEKDHTRASMYLPEPADTLPYPRIH